MYYRTVELDGLDIFYREAGPEDAPKILLLHGFPTSSHMFRNLIPALADKHPYKRDLKNLEFHLYDTGHFALEEDRAAIAALIRDFLGRHVSEQSAYPLPQRALENSVVLVFLSTRLARSERSMMSSI